MNNREKLKDKQRIIVKVGTSSLIHKATGNINLFRLEKLVRVLTDIFIILNFIHEMRIKFGLVFSI